jgi:CsoR family transcriptional regulator, copper-sensing transcriptional repressor
MVPVEGMGTIRENGEYGGSPFRGGKEEVTESVETGQRHGYIKEGDKEKLRMRLRRIEGQVRGVQRMIEEEAYCVDIITQISSYMAASEKVASLVLKDHMDHCVKAALKDGDKADEKMEELKEAIDRFLKLD